MFQIHNMRSQHVVLDGDGRMMSKSHFLKDLSPM